MSSLHAAVGGGLVLLHQVTAAPSVACPYLVPSISRACCCSGGGSGSAASSAVVPRFAGLRRADRSASSSSARSVVWASPRPPASGKAATIMPRSSWLSKLGFGGTARAAQTDASSSAALGPDDDKPAPGLQFATFGAGCFWGPELAFQRVKGVSKTEVGYSQGPKHNPTYGDVCDGDTGHAEVVRVQYDPNQCTYESLLDSFWARHDPTTLNRQGGDVGTQYRSGIYYYSPEQEKAARDSLEAYQAKINKKIVTEILPAKKFYRAEEYHQQYLSKGGRFGFRQSAEKGCNDPIRCYG